MTKHYDLLSDSFSVNYEDVIVKINNVECKVIRANQMEKLLRENKENCREAYQDGYNKALEDFADELKWLFSMYYTGSLNSKDIDDIVKDLKKGNKE